jgi:hypothetical protein
MDLYGTIQSQYQAALRMLGQAIAICPESLWDDDADRSRFYRVAYHALFYTHLYLQPTIADFVPWEGHKHGYESLDPAQASQEAALFTKQELVAYHELCREQVRSQVPALDLDAPSGFAWLPFNKLELQFYNIRHLQHHTGQLCERLRTRADLGVDWVGARHE